MQHRPQEGTVPESGGNCELLAVGAGNNLGTLKAASTSELSLATVATIEAVFI